MVFDARDNLLDIENYLFNTAANRPSAGTQGRLFLETDTGRTLYDNGSSWVEVGLSESQISLANLSSNSHSDLTNISSNDHHAKYTDEEAQDAVGGILNADFSYDDAGNSIALASNSLTVANTTIGLGESGTPEADNLAGNNGTSGQVLQTDGSNTSWTDVEERVAYETGHVQWADGSSNAEVHRIVLQSGEELVVDRIEFRQKGGGSSSNASVDVYDSTASSVIGSQNLGGTTKNPGSSTGNTVLVRVSNSTGSVVEGSIRVTGRVNVLEQVIE